MKKILFLGLAFVLTVAIAADAMKTHKDKKGKFTVKYPADWTLSTDQNGVPFMVNAPDSTANVQIMTDALTGKMTACEYLSQVEASVEGGRTNLIPENQRKATPAQTKFMGVKDGCIGAYKVMQGEVEVLQGMGIYVAEKSVWILIQTLQSAARQTHGKAVGDIAKSFTTR